MTGHRVLAAFVAIAMTGGVAWLSQAPTDLGGNDAVIRLSWRIAGVHVEACRTRTEDELAALPVHMRNPRECTRALAPFALDVTVGGRAVVRDTVFPRGMRGDRPVYVLRDLPAEPGPVALSVRFEAVLAEGAAPPDGVPTRYAWNGEISLASGDVALLTLDGAGKNLVLRRPKVRWDAPVLLGTASSPSSVRGP